VGPDAPPVVTVDEAFASQLPPATNAKKTNGHKPQAKVAAASTDKGKGKAVAGTKVTR
jgi:hypothetical protein